MKRFLFWFAVVLMGIFWLHRVRPHRPHPDRVMVHESVDPAGHAREVYLDRDGKVLELVADDEDDAGRVRREPAEGLPVPVVPGSRTTEARAEPPSASASPAHRRPRRHFRAGTVVPDPGRLPGADAPATAEPAYLLTVTGRLSATAGRARADARAKLETVLAERLAPEVPRGWRVPPELVDGMIRQTRIEPRTRDYGTVYEATIQADFSPQRRAEIAQAYHHQEVVKRLVVLGAVLAFVLACLAAVSGYIKADEATKGYYTTRLRVAAVAALAVAGVVVVRLLRINA